MWHSVMDLKKQVCHLFPEFLSLKDRLEDLVERAEEVFRDPEEKIKAALGPEVNMFEVARAVAATVQNLREVKECVRVASTFAVTAQLVSNEVKIAAEDVQKMARKAAA